MTDSTDQAVHKKRERDEEEPPTSCQLPKLPRTDAEPDNLDAGVRSKLNDMIASGLLSRDDLDRKALDELARVPLVDDQHIILAQFERSAGSNVRNKSAYLHGCIVRHQQSSSAVPATNNKALDPRVATRLTALYQSAPVKASDFDGRVFDFLSSLPPPSAITAIDRFQAKFTPEVRNICAFFTSILRSEQQNLDANQGRPLPSSSGPPPPPYPQAGYYPPQAPPPQFMPPPATHFPPQYPYGAPPQQPHWPPQNTPYAPPFMPPQNHPFPPVGNRRHFGAAQAQIGVRVGEFHTLSHLAPYVTPNAALRLQYYWDTGVSLLSSLDDRSWEALCDLSPNDAVAVIDQVSEAMRREHIRNPAAFFMTQAKRYLTSPPPGASYGHLFAPSQHQTLWQPPPGPSGGGGGGGGPSSINELPADMRSRAVEAISKNPRALNEQTFDSGIVQGLLRLPHAQAMECFDELLSVNLSNVRNPTAFLMGMIKKRKQ